MMLTLDESPDTADLTAKMPPVNDQGQLGSCTANTMCEAFEYVEGKGPSDDLFSRLDLYYASRAYEGTPPTEDSGCVISDVVKVLNDRGVCLESVWPYDTLSFMVAPPSNAVRKKVVLSLHLPNLDTMLACLGIQGFPFGFGFSVPQSMMSSAVAQSGILPMPADGESFVGGHAVLAVGYDKKKQIGASVGALLVRNSWGPGWGLQGNFWMPFDYINHGLADDAWTIRRTELQDENPTKTPGVLGAPVPEVYVPPTKVLP